MKRFLLFCFLVSCLSGYAQKTVVWSSDSSRIKYASFEEHQTRNMNAENFFSSVLSLPTSNVFFATDTVYSPTPSLCFVKYKQSYAGYLVENSQVTLTYRNNNIVRFSGHYVPITNMSCSVSYSEEDAVRRYKQFYNMENEDCLFSTELLITEDTLTPTSPVLCYRVESDRYSIDSKILYLDASTLSIIKEEYRPIAGFNGILHTKYNGIRNANTEEVPGLGYILQDPTAAVKIIKCTNDPTNPYGNHYFGDVILDTYINNTSEWGIDTPAIYPQYILDAYWSSIQYSNYMQNKLGCPKDFFQRFYNYQIGYTVFDTLTRIYISNRPSIGNTHFEKLYFSNNSKDLPHNHYANIIVVGYPENDHNPRASIDEIAHEFAHIFSRQSWDIDNHSSLTWCSPLSEACADIWAAIITHEIYPNDESRIWKIGEDVVLPTSGNTCVRNLANPADPYAEIQMLANYCDSLDGTSYEESGIISHWFYLLTHGYNGQGCNGNCYSFPAIPIDSAAKLMYYAERTCFNDDMDYSDICLATMNACENFSNPAAIRASVVGAWGAVGIRLGDDFGVERYGLSLTDHNANVYTIDENLVVDSLQTLIVAGTLHLNDSSRIIIKPGGKLVVDGGTLTSACEDGMWQGIYVEGHTDLPQTAANQGTVQLINGAVIENAHCAITTAVPPQSGGTPNVNQSLSTGGIITADGATFRNCTRAVYYLPYASLAGSGNVADNKGSFHNCTFTIDDNNLYASNGTDFIEHVRLWDVKGVTFSRCRFEDVRTGVHSRGIAVNAMSAGFTVRTECQGTAGHPYDCACPTTTNSYCSFSGFGTAVSASTSGSPYPVAIDGARFAGNLTGVSISGSSHASVTHCQFDLGETSVRAVIGLSLNGCTGYLVEENTFTRDASAPSGSRYGIRVNNSGTDANGLYRNTFERLSHGMYVTGTNGDGNSNTGLQMTCNEFTDNTYDMYLHSTAIVSSWQGDNSKGADNTFSGTQTSSLHNAGSQPLTYLYSAGTSHVPYNPTTGNVTLNGTVPSNNCASTLCSNGGGTPNPKSPTPSFLALKQQYENLMADFDRNGYADLLSTAIPPQAEPPASPGELAAAQYASQQMNAIASELFAQSHEAVRALMSDTLEDLRAVVAWLGATPGLASRYLEAETEFVVEANDNSPIQDVATHLTTTTERDEYDNYMAFHTLKQALEEGGHVMWPNATDAQIGELIRIADANTGRSSLLAKNVLCFFFGICYDDMETRALETTTIPPTAEPPTLTESRMKAESPTLTGQQNITVHPNPADDVLHVTVTDGEIARVEMFDMFGRITMVGTQNLASPPSPEYTVDLSSLPAGLYVLRVTLTDSTVRNVKVVRK